MEDSSTQCAPLPGGVLPVGGVWPQGPSASFFLGSPGAVASGSDADGRTLLTSTSRKGSWWSIPASRYTDWLVLVCGGSATGPRPSSTLTRTIVGSLILLGAAPL